MNRSNYGATANIISQITDPQQLQAMMKDPRYAGFTPVIIARISEITRERQAATAAQPQAPTVAQQVVQGAGQPTGMARGGIVAFKDGGKVKKQTDKKLEDYTYKQAEYRPLAPTEVPKDIRPTEAQGPDISDITADRPSAGIRGFSEGREAVNAMRRYSGENPDEWAAAAVAEEAAQPPQAPMGMEHSRPQASVDFSWLKPSGDPYQDRLAAAVAAATKKANAPKAKVQTPVQTPVQAAPEQMSPEASGPSLPPLTASQLGIRSVDGSGSASARVSRSDDIGDLPSYIKDMRRSMPENTDLADARKAAAEDRRQAIWTAMMHGGLGMAQSAGERPQLGGLGNLAAGAQAGLNTYSKDMSDQRANMRDITKQDRAERMGLATLAMQERGQDVRAARQDAMYRQGIAAQMREPALREQAIRNRQIDLANADRNPQTGRPNRPMSDYYVAAKRDLSDAYQGMEVRSQDAEYRDRLAGAKEALKNGEGDPVQKAILMQIVQSGGRFDPYAVNPGALGNKLPRKD